MSNIEQKAFKTVHDAIYEVTGCKDLKSGDLYLSRILVKDILALIAEEQQPLVESLEKAELRLIELTTYWEKGLPPLNTTLKQVRKVLIDTTLKGGSHE